MAIADAGRAALSRSRRSPPSRGCRRSMVEQIVSMTCSALSKMLQGLPPGIHTTDGGKMHRKGILRGLFKV